MIQHSHAVYPLRTAGQNQPCHPPSLLFSRSGGSFYAPMYEAPAIIAFFFVVLMLNRMVDFQTILGPGQRVRFAGDADYGFASLAAGRTPPLAMKAVFGGEHGNVIRDTPSQYSFARNDLRIGRPH
jgi:hypothetical protein